MKSDILFGVLLRLLPSLILLVLAFIAAGDRKSREQWTTLLYQAGSLHPDKRDDPDVQKTVRIPFFVVAFIFLILPIGYYIHANTTVEISTSAFGNSHKAAPGETAAANTATNSASVANTASATNAATATGATNTAGTPAAITPVPAGAATPAAPAGPDASAATPSFNPYASHKHH